MIEPLLIANQITRGFRSSLFGAKKQVLDKIDISIYHGNTVGIIGDNGAGKSTLFRVLAGILKPDTGIVRSRGEIVPLIEMGFPFHGDLSIQQNIITAFCLLSHSYQFSKKQVEMVYEFSKIKNHLKSKVKELSSGELIRLAVSIALHSSGNIFIIDEHLSIIDRKFECMVFSRIKHLVNQGAVIVMASHNEELLKKYCNQIYLLKHGKLSVY